MARMRRRDRMKDDPVGDYNETKSALDDAISSYQSAETVSTGEMFPVVRGGAKAEAAPESYFGEMSITERMKPAKAAAPAAGAGLAKGMFNNDDVRALQVGLLDIAAYSGDDTINPGDIDSDFGQNTENAVKAFQRKMGIDVTGVADDETISRMQMVRAGMQDDTPISQFTTSAMTASKAASDGLRDQRFKSTPKTLAPVLAADDAARADFTSRLGQMGEGMPASGKFARTPQTLEPVLAADDAERAAFTSRLGKGAPVGGKFSSPPKTLDPALRSAASADLMKRMEEKLGREDLMAFLDALGVVEST